MFEAIKYTKETWWHRLKRRFLATPILSIERGGCWTLSWHWKDGTVEVVKAGFSGPGDIIEVPARTKCVREV